MFIVVTNPRYARKPRPLYLHHSSGKKRASEEVMDIGIFVFESDSSLDPAVLARRAEELVWSGITGPFISIRIYEQTSSLV
ncbi:uncharacterized protein METZ01_LOCUS312156 [marine metagenome]|uniref:Uncharacterized protein n=1 Tax=marine metagenome TaxID=408172 RepID=A0A382NHX9_9ZZZZ